MVSKKFREEFESEGVKIVREKVPGPVRCCDLPAMAHERLLTI
jgi:hypothetical protein